MSSFSFLKFILAPDQHFHLGSDTLLFPPGKQSVPTSGYEESSPLPIHARHLLRFSSKGWEWMKIAEIPNNALGVNNQPE